MRRRRRRRGGYIRHVYRGGVLQRNVDTHADCKIAGRTKKRRATKAGNFASVIMSCFHADTLSRDRGVTPRLFVEGEKKRNRIRWLHHLSEDRIYSYRYRLA